MASSSPDIPSHAQEKLASIVDLHQHGEEGVDSHQRGVEWLTHALGRPRSLYMIVLAVALWVGLNYELMWSGHKAIDPPPFQGLQGVVTLAALLVATMVLTTQNRQHRADARRSRVALHMNMTAEAEVTKMIALLEELRRDMPNVRQRRDLEAEEMQKSVDPKQVATEMEAKLEGADLV